MKFELDNLKFVTICMDYLKALHDEDQEVFYSPEAAYKNKPHIGILLSDSGNNYVVPLTSAKPKHSGWKNRTGTNFLIYEIVSRATCDSGDILKELSSGSGYDPAAYVEKVLSVVEIKKMIPIKDGVYSQIDFSAFNMEITEERQRKGLLVKEYEFCMAMRDYIQIRANKIYKKQVDSGIVLPFHCNYKKLENVCDNYKVSAK